VLPQGCGERLREERDMRRRRFPAAAVVPVAVLLAASVATAQVYVSDQFGHEVFRFGLGQTVGSVANPDTPLSGIEDMELDSGGRLLVSRNGDVVLFDPADQSVVLLDGGGECTTTYATYPDGASSDVYVVRGGCASGAPELQYLPGGTGPAQTGVVFEDSDKLRDVQVWPFGERAGNILVLSVDPPFMAEVERTGPTTFVRLGNLFETSHANLRGFSITPEGDILVIDFNDGQFVVENGELVPFGEPVGPGLQDISVGANGTIYITDSYDNIVHRFTSDGTLILPAMGEGQLTTPRAVAAAGFTPTPPGENVSTHPGEGVDIIFEEVVQGGFTTAGAVPSTERVSPGGNFLPDYVEAPGQSGEFLYFDIGTESIYSRLIQVEIWMEGTRMFFAHGTQDTFRDVTIDGPIEDARGTIGRFSEVVLVEDMRPLSTVAEYKFQRLISKVEELASVGTAACPKNELKNLRRVVRGAKQKYDRGRFDETLAILADVNMTIRSLAGWCIPDTYPDNHAGETLALSKTLMFSIRRLMAPARGGADVASPTSLALSATSPVTDRSVIELTGPAGTEVAARVYSSSGRLVTTLFEGRLDGNAEHLTWPGTDQTGKRVASGVYFVRLESANESVRSKVVLVR
jgi:hypothetical protein